MAMVLSTTREPDRDRAGGSALSRLIGRLAGTLGALIGLTGMLASARLDDMSEAQLKDIGMVRIAHGLRWPDHAEYEHRLAADDRLGGEGLRR